MDDIAIQIANRFAAILREWLTPTEWTAMLSANATETDPGVCHSHDHCDANMAMDRAFRDCGLAALLDSDQMSEDTCRLWSTAWRDAFKRHLSTPA